MNTTFLPMSQRRLAELRGYVAWGPALFRGLLFGACVGAVAWLLRTAHTRLGRPLIDSESWMWTSKR